MKNPQLSDEMVTEIREWFETWFGEDFILSPTQSAARKSLRDELIPSLLKKAQEDLDEPDHNTP